MSSNDRICREGRVTIRFEPRDLWIGLFWDRRPDGLHFYVCPVPCIPKGIENRTWVPPASMIGRYLAIHAGVRFDDDVGCSLIAMGSV